MSNIAKLKKKAAEFEQKKQYEKALDLYQQVLDLSRASDEERDVPLYNRVGDLHFRLGNSEEAITYYEKAVDLYAEGGFFNNAIALCNKILRYSPNRSVVYYKLGLISAKKGFNSDAKQNLLEYADRMQKAGKLDEAFRALKEFADLCPGQDDVRLMLAEQLTRADRKAEALEQLQLLYDTLESEGRTTEAAAAIERMKTLDPTFTPRKTTTPRQRKKEGLVFLDLDYNDDVPADSPPSVKSEASLAGEPSPAPAVGALDGLELTSLGEAEPSSRSQREADPGTEEFELISHEGDAAATEGRADSAESQGDAVVPVLGETTLSDPLAGLDVISTGPAETSTGDEAGSGETTRTDSIYSTSPDDYGSDEEARPGGFVDLRQWLEETRTPQSTRMVAHDEVPENNQQKDFEEMLEKFKLGISRSVEETDFDSHYDLGIAFREMGLVDEAITAFQKATRGGGYRIRASEALGECFIEKEQPAVAATVLDRIVAESGLNDDALVGVFYLLGRAAEEMDKPEKAAGYYQRVIAVDTGFRDAAERLSSLTKAAK